jgi:hypothetical protein
MAILAPPPWKPDQSVIVKPCYFYSNRRCNIFYFWKRSVGLQPIQLSSQLPPHTVSAMFGTPLPICCATCRDNQLMCEAHPHTKGSCYHCIVNGLPCLFPPKAIIRHGSPRMTNAFRFQRNCVHRTRSHQKCVFDTDSPLQCKGCMKLKIPCLFQLSSQGSRNDLNASTDPKDAMTMLMKSAVVVCDGRSTKLDGAHSPPKPLDPNGRFVNVNKSVHYHHCSNGYSCHGRVEPVTISD